MRLISFEPLQCRVRVAQWIARLPPKQKVAGSNPASDVRGPPTILARCPSEVARSVELEFLVKERRLVVHARPINSVGRVTGS